MTCRHIFPAHPISVLVQSLESPVSRGRHLKSSKRRIVAAEDADRRQEGQAFDILAGPILSCFSSHQFIFECLSAIDTMKVSAFLLCLATTALAESSAPQPTETGMNTAAISSALCVISLQAHLHIVLGSTTNTPQSQPRPNRNRYSNSALRKHLSTPEVPHPRNPLRRPPHRPLGTHQPDLPQLPRQRVQCRLHARLVHVPPHGREELHVRRQFPDRRGRLDGDARTCVGLCQCHPDGGGELDFVRLGGPGYCGAGGVGCGCFGGSGGGASAVVARMGWAGNG